MRAYTIVRCRRTHPPATNRSHHYKMRDNTADKILLLWQRGQPELFGALTVLVTEIGWQVVNLAETRVLEEYNSSSNQSSTRRIVCLAILNQSSFSSEELGHIRSFYAAGNSLMVAASGGESEAQNSNLNLIVSQFGIRFNRNCVIRPNPYKHYHPEEAQLEDFIANRGLSDTLKKYIQANWRQQRHRQLGGEATNDDGSMVAAKTSITGQGGEQGNLSRQGPRILYARGCTLEVSNKKVSTIMMTSSKWALPSNQAICAFHRAQASKQQQQVQQQIGGSNNSSSTPSSRMIAIGSAQMMSDLYIDKEDNKALIKTLFEFISIESFPINISDARTIEIPELNWTPDINQLLEAPIPCFRESEPLPENKWSLIDGRLFSIDCSHVPMIGRAYQELGLTQEPLTLIKPNFERKQLELEPATHGFLLRGRPVPSHH